MAARDADSFVTNAAFWAAAIAFLSFVLGKLYELLLRRHDYWDGRRASIIRFRTDIWLRREDLLSKKVAFNDPAYRDSIVALIEQHASEGRNFRLYGVEVTDTRVQDDISTYLATFPEKSQALIRQAILRDRQMVALYRMNTTAAFQNLSAGRQIKAFDDWLASVNELIVSLDALTADQGNWSPEPYAWLDKLVTMSKAE